MRRWWQDYTTPGALNPSLLEVHAGLLLTYVGGSASTFLAWWMFAGCPW